MLYILLLLTLLMFLGKIQLAATEYTSKFLRNGVVCILDIADNSQYGHLSFRFMCPRRRKLLKVTRVYFLTVPVEVFRILSVLFTVVTSMKNGTYISAPEKKNKNSVNMKASAKYCCGPPKIYIFAVKSVRSFL